MREILAGTVAASLGLFLAASLPLAGASPVIAPSEITADVLAREVKSANESVFLGRQKPAAAMSLDRKLTRLTAMNGADANASPKITAIKVSVDGAEATNGG